MNSKPRKVLFAHDGPLFTDENKNFYGIHITEKLKQRYLYLGDELTVLMRVKEIDGSQASRYSKIEKENFTVVPVPNFKTITKYLFERPRIKKDIEKVVMESDVIVSRIPSTIGSIVIEYAKKHKKPYLVEFVGCSWDAFWGHSLKGKFVAPYFYIAQKFRMKTVPYVIYVTEKFLQERYPTNGLTTNCSNVELKEIDDAVLERRLGKIRNYTGSEQLVLGTVAAIDVLYKAQADVIEALAILKKQGKKFTYRIVGQGDRSYLEKKIAEFNMQDEVEIVGALKHDEVFKFLDSIDLYIHPSKQEGLPRAVIESMSRACAVLGAKTGGIPELIDNKYIFPKGGIQDIVRLLKLVGKEEMLKMAAENFEKSKEYTSDIINERRLNFFDRFLKEQLDVEKK